MIWPFWRRVKLPRSMSCRLDTCDSLGGYPFEVALPEAKLELVRDYGFELASPKITAEDSVAMNLYF